MPAPGILRINEVFWSAQGEGLHLGTPAIFVRLTGCSLRCPICDTKGAWENGEFLPVSDIVKKALRFKVKASSSRIIITGGEPLEQSLAPLIGALRTHFSSIAIETNGLHFQALDLDWWSVSPKQETGYRIHPQLIPRASEIKLIASESLAFVQVKKIRLLIPEAPIFLQPEHGQPQSYRIAFDLFRRSARAGLANIQLGIQLQRIYGIV